MDFFDWANSAVGFVFAFVSLGAPFFLWRRSRTAALLGAGAGVVALGLSLADLALTLSRESSTSSLQSRRLIRIVMSFGGNTTYYALLFACLVVLARRPR